MKLFKDLSPEEEAVFRKWARENYKPFSEISGIWHPAVQDECVKMNAESELPLPLAAHSVAIRG